VDAAHWYAMAANQNMVDAQCNLGIMYRDGRGVAQSKEKAMHWLKKAAHQGCNIVRSILEATPF